MIELVGFVILPVIAGMILYLMPERIVKAGSILVQAVLIVTAIRHYIDVHMNGMVVERLGGWSDNMGITLQSDRLTAVLIVLTACLFLLYLFYSFTQSYVRNLFVTLLLLQQGLMMGVFLAGDLFNLYVMLEVITLIVTLMIQFKREKRSVYDGLIYLMINTVAMVFYLFGVGLVYRLFGVLDIQSLTVLIRDFDQPRQLILPFSLMMTAVAVKAALFPLFSWLPKAHGTPGSPTVVSALLSGLSVKMGLYLFIRLRDLFASQIDSQYFFLGVGFLTGIAGVILAMRQTDIKRLLAYSTISQVGLILIGISHGTERAHWGAIYHLINHAVFKSALFMIAGLIVEIWGSRNIRRISGVFYRIPLVAIAAILAILGITGAPLFNGSISKYLIGSDFDGTFFQYALILLNLGTMIVFVRFAGMFFGKSDLSTGSAQQKIQKVPISRRIVVGILGLICFIGGLFGGSFVSLLFDIEITFNMNEYLIKLIIYLSTLAAGVLINRFVKKRLDSLPCISRREPGFNRMSLATVGYFTVLVGYLLLSLR